MDADAINMMFGVIGTIGTILGIVGIVLTIRSIKKKEPIYSIKSNNLISGSASILENLHIFGWSSCFRWKILSIQDLNIWRPREDGSSSI